MQPQLNKKDKLLWTRCSKCNYLVSKAKLGTKTECSEIGIFENKFYTDKIYASVPREFERLKSLYSERFVFVPETIASLCFLSMNNSILIQIDGVKKYAKHLCIIKNDSEVDHVYSSSQELQMEMEQNSKIEITPFQGTVKIARKITIMCKEKYQNLKELERLVRAKLKNTTVHPSNIIGINFLNKLFEFSIKSIEAQPDRELDRAMAQLDVGDNLFYFIEPRTVINLTYENDNRNNLIAVAPTLDNMGGLDEIYLDLNRTIVHAFNQPDNMLSTKVFRGVLLHGLSGTGKTLLAETAAKSFPFTNIVRIDSWKIFSKFYGESEENLRKLFNEAFQVYPCSSVILIDEISNLCPKNDSSDVVRKVSSLLMSLLESVHQKVNGSRIFIIATTNNLDNVDPAIRRSGRLDYEIEVPVPNTEMRKQILMKKLRAFEFSEDVINSLAKCTHGYVGADLEKLIEKSKKIELDSVILSCNTMFANISSIKPSAMRELMIEKPNVKWSDIGGMQDLKLKLQQIIEWPLQHPETFSRLGIKPPSGLLMFGAPGCSKTMIAKALATESNLNFISIKGSDLFSMWVGESEKAVRDLFIKARQLAPCIIFFDEIDAIGGERESGSSVKERVLAQILTEMDGVNALKNVIIIAATNRPDLIDKALMRPGRLDRIVYVKLPDMDTRREIFNIKLKNVPTSDDVDVETLVGRTEGYSGAEIEAICKEAALKALEDSFDVQAISMSYFMHALEIVKPRTSPELLQIYNDYENRK